MLSHLRSRSSRLSLTRSRPQESAVEVTPFEAHAVKRFRGKSGTMLGPRPWMDVRQPGGIDDGDVAARGLGARVDETAGCEPSAQHTVWDQDEATRRGSRRTKLRGSTAAMADMHSRAAATAPHQSPPAAASQQVAQGF
eukprot:3571087-Prymnesium_polylepis.1